MITKEALKEIIVSNEKFIGEIERIVKREYLLLPEKINKVIVFSGVRRSGKTYCLFDIFKQNKERALYIDFEDERLLGFGINDFQKLKDSLLELKPDLTGKELVFLLDEIQNISGWERFARRAIEKDRIKVFVSGSSSKMTPQHLHTSLRGRSWNLEIYPFSFREYLGVKGINSRNKKVLYGESRHIIKKHLYDYLKWGGFPEVCFLELEIEKRKVLKEYLEAIFFKDLVERCKISNIYLLDALRDKLFESSALKISLNSLYKQYKGKFPFSKDSLFAYYRHYLDSLIVFEVRKFSPSSYKRLRNPAKIFLIDPGISRRTASQDYGRQMENVVFLELKRRGFEVFYFEEKNECDFIVKEYNGVYSPLQVTWELTPENRGREFQGLVQACKMLGIKNGTIITHDEEREEKEDGITIDIVPVWKWLILQ